MAQIRTQCYVNWAGPVIGAAINYTPTPDPVVLITLSAISGKFQNQGFFAPPAARNQMLAVALAAISTQSPVEVLVDEPPAAAGQYLQCYQIRVKGSN
jgi:hypothetical protein